MIKLDVEGWELNVLSSLVETISKAVRLTLFCEFNPRAQECAGRAPTELITWLMDKKFSLAYPCDGQLRSLSNESVERFVAEPGRKGFTTLFATRAVAGVGDRGYN